MEEREENTHERLKQKLSELEREWTAMKTGKSSSAVSWITVEGALEFVENSPRKLMLSLQHDRSCPEAEMTKIKSPFRKKLFHDSESDEDFDGSKGTSFAQFTPSSCLSSNVMIRVRENKKNKQRGRLVSITVMMMMVLLLLVLVVLINGFEFDHPFMDRQIHTLVPT